jgi:hypothetical protein
MKQDQEDERERYEQLDDGDNSGQQLENPFSLAGLQNGPIGRKYAGLPALLQELGMVDGTSAVGRFVAIPAPRVPVFASPTEWQ